MLSWSKKNALSIFLGLSVLAYQGLNLIRGDFLTPREHWRTGNIWLSLNQRSLFSIPTITEWGGTTAHDFTSRWLKGFGYSLKYLAGDIPEGVLLGIRDPYLHLTSRNEIPFQYPETYEAVQTNVVRPLALYAEELARAGVRVVFVPSPTKLSIVREAFPPTLPIGNVWGPGTPRLAPPENAERVYSAITDTLGDHAVDLYHLFQSHRQTHQEEIYLYDDLHLTSYGLNLAAMAAIQKLLTWKLVDQEPKWIVTGNMGRSYQHDILAMLQLPESFLNTRPEFGWPEPLYVLSSAVRAPSADRLILLGSSMSHRFRDTPHSLGRILANSLGRDLVQYAIPGGNAAAGLKHFIEDGLIFKPGDLVVWEFPMQAKDLGPRQKLPFQSPGLPEPARSLTHQ